MKYLYHHNDLDGHCSAAIYKYRAEKDGDSSLILREINYGYKYEEAFGDLTKDDEVVFVDFCPEKEDYDKLVATVNKVTVYDHHKSRSWINTEGNFFDDSKAASMIVWEALFPEQPLPPSVYATSMWDTWQHDADPRIVPWHDGCQLLITDPATEDGYAFWENTFENTAPIPENMTEEERAARMQWDTVMQVINMGMIVSMYKSCKAEANQKNLHDMTIDGKKFLMLNTKLSDSYEFPPVIDDSYFGYGWYWWTGSEWIFNLRSKGDNDLTSIPGVGGHKNAAGFHMYNFPDASIYLKVEDESN